MLMNNKFKALKKAHAALTIDPFTWKQLPVALQLLTDLLQFAQKRCVASVMQARDAE